MDADKVKQETADYEPIPEICSFLDADGKDTMQQQIQENYDRIKAEVVQIIENELTRIENDPDLMHLLGGGEQAQG